MHEMSSEIDFVELRHELKPFNVIHSLGNVAVILESQISDLNRITASNGAGSWNDNIKDITKSFRKDLDHLHYAMDCVGVRGWTAPEGTALKVFSFKHNDNSMLLESRMNEESSWNREQDINATHRGLLELSTHQIIFKAGHLKYMAYGLWAYDKSMLARVKMLPGLHMDLIKD